MHPTCEAVPAPPNGCGGWAHHGFATGTEATASSCVIDVQEAMPSKGFGHETSKGWPGSFIPFLSKSLESKPNSGPSSLSVWSCGSTVHRFLPCVIGVSFVLLPWQRIVTYCKFQEMSKFSASSGVCTCRTLASFCRNACGNHIAQVVRSLSMTQDLEWLYSVVRSRRIPAANSSQ